MTYDLTSSNTPAITNPNSRAPTQNLSHRTPRTQVTVVGIFSFLLFLDFDLS